MKILMTGGTGFVGSYLAARLLKDGHEVTILIRSSEELRGATPRVSFLQGDPTQRGAWQRVVPRRLLGSGFVFQYPQIDKAIESVVRQ